MKIEVVADVKPLLGEGPLWDVTEQRLYFIDILGKRIFRCAADGGEMRAWTTPSEIGAMALRKGGGAVLALRDGFHIFDFDTGECTPICDPESDRPTTRLNDGKVDPAGRFVAGGIDMEEAHPKAALWQLGPDLTAVKMDDGIICTNGPCWSPDGATFYFTDSFTGQIDQYDYNVATGAATNRRLFTQVESEPGGAPDGMTVDSEGFVWSATVYDGRIRRYAPDGSVDREIKMPVVKITSVMFGGPNLDQLFVTSMAEPPLPKYPDDPQLRGSLFKITGLGLRGLPEPRFAG